MLIAVGAIDLVARKCAGVAMPFSASLDGNDRDLDQHPRIGKLSLNAGAAGKVLTLGPRVPSFIHGIAQTDVGHPDGGGYHFRLVGAAELQETINFLKNLLGLPLCVLIAVRGSDAGGKHKAIGLDGLGQKFRWLVARGGHGVLLLYAMMQDVFIARRSRRAISQKLAPYCNMPSI